MPLTLTTTMRVWSVTLRDSRNPTWSLQFHDVDNGTPVYIDVSPEMAATFRRRLNAAGPVRPLLVKLTITVIDDPLEGDA